MKLKSVFSLTAVVLLSTAVIASAQTGGGGRGNRGNRGNRSANNANNANANAADPNAQNAQGGNGMQRRTDRLKTELKASDEEWTVLQPLIEKVMTAQRETRAGGGMGGRGGGAGGRGNRGGQGNQTVQGAQGAPAAQGAQTDASEAQALRTALNNESTPPADIQAKLTALRQQRKKAAGDLSAARENLKKVLTQRQEAVLVMASILE